MKDLRIGVLSGRDIEPGDILAERPADVWGVRTGPDRVIGTVTEVHVYGAGVNSWEPTYQWTVVTPDGATITHPEEPVNSCNQNVHVPRGGQ